MQCNRQSADSTIACRTSEQPSVICPPRNCTSLARCRLILPVLPPSMHHSSCHCQMPGSSAPTKVVRTEELAAPSQGGAAGRSHQPWRRRCHRWAWGRTSLRTSGRRRRDADFEEDLRTKARDSLSGVFHDDGGGLWANCDGGGMDPRQPERSEPAAERAGSGEPHSRLLEALRKIRLDRNGTRKIEMNGKKV